MGSKSGEGLLCQDLPTHHPLSVSLSLSLSLSSNLYFQLKVHSSSNPTSFSPPAIGVSPQGTKAALSPPSFPSRLEPQFEVAAMGLSSSRSRLVLLGCKLL
uniref:Uncharacterized protein n=1 Tax=Micrurus corallinus TaxID=54390 RepID=A0A2D4FX66_MICCO